MQLWGRLGKYERRAFVVIQGHAQSREESELDIFLTEVINKALPLALLQRRPGDGASWRQCSKVQEYPA